MRFNNWNLEMDTFPVRQYDNLTRRLEVSGDIPDGWSWVALLSIGDNLNIISLQYGEPGLYVDLTADMIPYPGKYNFQLRATKGDKVRHTNIVYMTVNESMNGDVQWPELPSEFSQAEQRIADLNAHPSIPGQNGFWLVWDPETQQYKESDYPLPDVPVGPAGKAATIEVAETVTGEPGSVADVQNLGDENAARLRFTIPRGQTGPVGATGATPDISARAFGLPAGSDPTVSVSGEPEAPVISIGIPAGQQGAPGARGSDGADGETPNISIGTVDTLPAGASVTASITGQTPNLVLNLGIPQGKQGEPYALTDEDKQTIVQDVIAELPVYNGEVE